MIESLFKGKSQKTTREHETKRSGGQLVKHPDEGARQYK
jgi:hypothetical protein